MIWGSEYFSIGAIVTADEVGGGEEEGGVAEDGNSLSSTSWSNKSSSLISPLGFSIGDRSSSCGGLESAWSRSSGSCLIGGASGNEMSSSEAGVESSEDVA